MSKGLRMFATFAAAVIGGSFAIGFVTSSVSEQITLRRKVETGLERYSNYLLCFRTAFRRTIILYSNGASNLLSSTKTIGIAFLSELYCHRGLPLQKKYGRPCGNCRGVGFYTCKLCKSNGTIKWSPLYDPLVINPCVCPTCDGFKVQRCLNCLGGGIQG